MQTRDVSESELGRRERQRAASLNVNEAARRAGVSPSYMNRLRVTGGGPIYQKIGRRVTYSPDDIDVWLDARRRSSTTESFAA